MTISHIVRRDAANCRQVGSTPPTRELLIERWCDEDGNVFTVVVWRAPSKLKRTFYTLDDGTPVEFKSDSIFRIVPTGKLLFPCED